MCVEKIRWLGVLGLTVFLVSAAAAAAEPSASETMAEPGQNSAAFYLSASFSDGVSTLSNTGLDTNGTQMEIMLLGSLVLPSWIIEGGGGWFLSDLSGGGQATGALQSYSLSTAAGVAELSPQYRLTDRLQIGPVMELLFGTDVSFGGLGSTTQDMTLLGGAQALYEFRLGMTSLKLGARYLASLDLPGEMLQSVQATIQFGLPILY